MMLERDFVVKDVFSGVNEISLQVVSSCLFGLQAFSNRGSHEARLRNAITDAFRCLGEIGASGGGASPLPWAPTSNSFKLRAALERLDDIVFEIIRRKRRQQLKQRFNNDTSKSSYRDLLGALLAAFFEDDEVNYMKNNDEASAMLDKQLKDELLTLLVAGQETSALTVSWALSFLAQHEEYAHKIAEEAFLATSVSPGERMRKMKFTQAVVLETMRLRPPAYIVGRCTSRTGVSLGNYKLRQGQTVLVSPYVMHRSSKYWEDANSFVPHRWLNIASSETEEDILVPSALVGTYNSGAYIPFGGGPRNCIGSTFAMMETTLMVGEICKAFEFSHDVQSPKAQPFVTLRPENNNMYLKFRKRKRNLNFLM